MIIKNSSTGTILYTGVFSQKAFADPIAFLSSHDDYSNETLEVTLTANETRQLVRSEIEPTAGDTQSIQGTIADNVGLLLEELGRFMGVATTSTDPVLAGAAQPLASALAPLVAAVDGNTCTLTHHVKGTAQVVTDACTRANAVSTVLESHAAP